MVFAYHSAYSFDIKILFVAKFDYKGKQIGSNIQENELI